MRQPHGTDIERAAEIVGPSRLSFVFPSPARSPGAHPHLADQARHTEVVHASWEKKRLSCVVAIASQTIGGMSAYGVTPLTRIMVKRA